jgi:hypothetical protein
MYSNKIKGRDDHPIANLILTREKLKALPLKSGMKQWCSLSTLLFNTVLQVLSRAIKQWNKIKGYNCDRMISNSSYVQII